MRDEQAESQQSEKRRPWRPRVMEMPPPIPGTPENILKTILAEPPKKNWRYLEEHEEGRDKFR